MSNELLINGPASLESYADNLQQKLQIAQILLRSGMLPSSYKSPDAVLTAILYGKELGFSPMRALNAIHVIQGRPSLAAEGLKALALSKGARLKTIAWNEQLCTLECSRDEWVESFTYSIEDARRQELLGKDNWKRMPKQMLYARCVSTLIRNMYADVLCGVYSTEEMQDSNSEPVKVTVAPAKKQKVVELPEPKLDPKSEADVPDFLDDLPLPSIEDLKKEREMEELANPTENFKGLSYRYEIGFPEDLSKKQLDFLDKEGFVFDMFSGAWYSNEFVEKMKKDIRGPKK